MTTESRPTGARPTSRWTPTQSREERQANKDHFRANKDAISDQFPRHWIAIYGGDRVVGFEDGKDLIAHMNELDDFTRGCSYWVNTLKPPQRPLITSVFRRR